MRSEQCLFVKRKTQRQEGLFKVGACRIVSYHLQGQRTCHVGCPHVVGGHVEPSGPHGEIIFLFYLSHEFAEVSGRRKIKKFPRVRSLIKWLTRGGAIVQCHFIFYYYFVRCGCGVLSF